MLDTTQALCYEALALTGLGYNEPGRPGDHLGCLPFDTPRPVTETPMTPITTQSLSDLLTHPAVQDVIALPARTMGGGGDPVDLDITFVIYLVIFLLTWGLLNALLFQPYLKVRDAREKGISGNRGEADEMRAAAESKMSTYKEALARAKAEASSMRESLKGEANAEESRILAAAREESSSRLEAHRAQMAAQIESAKSEMQSSAESLSAVMVERLLPS